MGALRRDYYLSSCGLLYGFMVYPGIGIDINQCSKQQPTTLIYFVFLNKYTRILHQISFYTMAL